MISAGTFSASSIDSQALTGAYSFTAPVRLLT